MLYEESRFMLIHQVVQCQSDSDDCGIFTIVFATSLCAGENPGKIHYIQHLFIVIKTKPFAFLKLLCE